MSLGYLSGWELSVRRRELDSHCLPPFFAFRNFFNLTLKDIRGQRGQWLGTVSKEKGTVSKKKGTFSKWSRRVSQEAF